MSSGRRLFFVLYRLFLKEALLQFRLGPGARTRSRGMLLMSLLAFFVFGWIGSIGLLNFRDPAPAYLIYFTLLFVALLYLTEINFSGLLVNPLDMDRLLVHPIPPSLYLPARLLAYLTLAGSWALAYALPMLVAHFWRGGLFLVPTFLLSTLLALPLAVAFAFLIETAFRRLLPAFPELPSLVTTLLLLVVLGLSIRLLTPGELPRAVLWTSLQTPWALLNPGFWLTHTALLPFENPSPLAWTGFVLLFSFLLLGYRAFRRSSSWLLLVLSHQASARPAHLRLPSLERLLGRLPPRLSHLTLLIARLALRDPEARLPLATLFLSALFLLFFFAYLAPLPGNIDPANRTIFSTFRTLERFLYYLCLTVVLLLQNSVFLLTHTTRHPRASWLWWSAPLRPSELWLAGYLISLLLSLPVYFLLAVLLFWRYGWDWRLAFEIPEFWLLSVLSTQVLALALPYVPFSAGHWNRLLDLYTLALALLLPLASVSLLGSASSFGTRLRILHPLVLLFLVGAVLAVYWFMARVPTWRYPATEVSQ